MHERITRRDLLIGAGGLVLGGLVAGDGVNLWYQTKIAKDKEKVVGGIWLNKQRESVKDGILLRFRPDKRGIGEVHHVAFTAPPTTAPLVPHNPDNIEDVRWKVLKDVRPNKNGACELFVKFSDIGAPFGECTFGADVYGREENTGHETTETLNYSANSSLVVIH